MPGVKKTETVTHMSKIARLIILQNHTTDDQFNTESLSSGAHPGHVEEGLEHGRDATAHYQAVAIHNIILLVIHRAPGSL